MNREIKFRVWDNVNKRFSDKQHFIDSEGNMFSNMDPSGVYMSGSISIGYRSQFSFGGMFTGFKDKNGFEIYEGDIVEGLYPGSSHGLYRNKIEWNNEGACWYFANADLCVWEGLTVIGNIFDNPELLKDE